MDAEMDDVMMKERSWKADYHCHSHFSHDGKDSVPELLRAAEMRRLQELCITDHCELSEPIDIDTYLAGLASEALEYQGSVRLLKGLELGQGNHHPALAEQIAGRGDWDFIIGSLHELKGYKDFYYLKYRSEEHCQELLDQYFTELCELARGGSFDVLGHVSYPLRYMCARDGFHPEPGRHEKKLRTLFGILRDSGKGIELNSSELYKNYRQTVLPPEILLRLYRDCGGEIVTIGSDAHQAAHVGGAFDEALELCRGAGFTRIAAFRGRKLRYETL